MTGEKKPYEDRALKTKTVSKRFGAGTRKNKKLRLRAARQASKHVSPTAAVSTSAADQEAAE